MIYRTLISITLIIASITASAQKDSSAIQLPVKVNHAEPLCVDLIRDLGARRGEREWNIGWGIKDEKETVEQIGFAEYEFSPINRLGLEAEIPFTVSRHSKYDNSTTTGFTVE
ncbi:MAG TPA: hypothetical protein VEC12_08905, partial [Bacteroidia bacterium]|nr:hypothetical protein [Bacteroidia bacterium]